jgi:hypothetical protein
VPVGRFRILTGTGGESEAGEQRLQGVSFHALAVQYTAGDTQSGSSRSSHAAAGGADNGSGNGLVLDESEHNWSDFTFDANSFNGQTLERICRDANQSGAFNKIMRTLLLRFQSCRAAGCRGTAGNNCKRALYLLGE